MRSSSNRQPTQSGPLLEVVEEEEKIGGNEVIDLAFPDSDADDVSAGGAVPALKSWMQMPRLRRVLLIIVEVRADNSAKPDAVALLKLNQKTKTRKAKRAAKQQKRIAP